MARNIALRSSAAGASAGRLEAEVRIDDRPHAAIVADEAADEGEIVAALVPRRRARRARRDDVDRANTGVTQRNDLRGAAGAVAIRVAPDDELGKRRIFRVDAAVTVRVELGESAEAVVVLAAERRVAEELRRAVDRAVRVPVDREE